MTKDQKTNLKTNENPTIQGDVFSNFSIQQLRAFIEGTKTKIAELKEELKELETRQELTIEEFNKLGEILAKEWEILPEGSNQDDFSEEAKEALNKRFVLDGLDNELIAEITEQETEIENQTNYLTSLTLALSKKLEEKESRLGEWEQQEQQAKEEQQKQIALRRAATKEGKEVIKAETSQALIKIKENFENLQISVVDYQKTKNALTEKLLELHERQGAEAEIDLKRYITFFEDSYDAQRRRRGKAEKVSEVLTRTINSLINNSLTNLEHQKKKADKKLGQLITQRDEEVKNALIIINDLETLLSETQEKYKDLEKASQEEIENLQEQSEEKVKNLQAAIAKLNEQIAEIKKKEAHHSNLYKRELDTQLVKEREGKQKTKHVMNNESQELQSVIRRLEQEKSKMMLSADFFQKQAEQRQLEANDLKDMLEKETNRLQMALEQEKTRLANLVNAKQNELERERQIFLNKKTQLENDVKEWKQKYNDAQTEINELMEEPDENIATINQLTTDKQALESEVNNLKEIETKYKQLTHKSWWNKTCDKLGITAVKNAIANAVMIAVICAVIYGISLLLKYIIKPAYQNLKGLRSKKDPEPTTTPAAPVAQQPPIQQQPIYYQAPVQQPQPATIIKEIVREVPVNVIEEKKPVKVLESETPKASPFNSQRELENSEKETTEETETEKET